MARSSSRRTRSATDDAITPLSTITAYEERRQGFAESTGVDGLYSIGRNGEFAHLLMEDIYWRTLKRMGGVASYVGQDV